jgi:N-acetylglutamate synthase-like GNAT family acetyltransferase
MMGPVPRNTWVVRVGNEVVAFAGLDFIQNQAAILEGIVVKKELRHQGIGAMLIKHRIQVARARGVKVFALATMYYLYNFYKRRGFKTCPRANLPDFLQSYPQFTDKRYKKCAVMVRGIR